MATQEQEGVIASDSVEDIILEDCHARGLRFTCPRMTHLSMRLTKVTSFTLQNCSNLRSLDLQCKLPCGFQDVPAETVHIFSDAGHVCLQWVHIALVWWLPLHLV